MPSGRPASSGHSREARGLARIAHPNVIGVHDVGVDDGRVWLAMEYGPGVRSANWLAAGRGPAAIHAASLVHRGIKPDNVLLGRRRRAPQHGFDFDRHGSEPSDGPAGTPPPSGS